ncbi:MAG: hypothetical protein HQL28_06685 [Candidatus Omnitrophica bacterium]|nr:hypothetical protein [Candidatus Omnitrophota bacterium]
MPEWLKPLIDKDDAGEVMPVIEKWRAETMGEAHAAVSSGFEVYVGIRSETYGKLAAGDIADLEKSIRGLKKVVPLDLSRGREQVLKDLEKATGGNKSIVILLDETVLDGMGTSMLLATIKDAAEKVSGDVASSLDGGRDVSPESVKAVTDLAGMRGALKVLVCRQAPLVSKELNEKSLFQLRAEEIFSLYANHGYSESAGYLALPGPLKNNGGKIYAASAVESAFELKFILESIRERRDLMGVKSEMDDPIKDFILIRGAFNQQQIEEMMKIMGYENYVDKKRIILLESGKRLSLEELKNRMAVAENTEAEGSSGEGVTAIGWNNMAVNQKTDIVIIDETTEESREAFDGGLVAVKAEKARNVLNSQIYEAMIQVIARRCGAPSPLGAGFNEVRKGLFLFLPETLPIDIDHESAMYDANMVRLLKNA